ncbi:MAG TPA: hypothetical protein PK297_12785, partial [Spirochaetota bacterium]|nr:hypothetical protein [Spirochaetota bacterium]
MMQVLDRNEWELSLFDPYLDPADELPRRVLAAVREALDSGDAQLARDLVVLGEPQDPGAALLVVLALLVAGHEGSLCLGLETTRLVALLTRAGCEPGDATAAAKRIHAWLKKKNGLGALVTLVGSMEETGTTPMVVLKQDGSLVRVWWQRLFRAERRLEQAFLERRQLAPVTITASLKKAALARGTAFAGMTLNG